MNANFDTVYGQVNKLGSAISVDQTNKRVGINVASPQSVFQIASGSDTTFTTAFHGGIGGGIANRFLIATGEPGIQLSSNIVNPLGTDTVTSGNVETSLLGLQIGSTIPNIPAGGRQLRGIYNQLFFGGNPFLIVDAAPNTDSSNDTFPIERFRIHTNGYVGIGGVVPSYPLHMASGAYVTTGGAWTNASSREFKDNINALSLDSAMTTLEQLNPVTFTYKKEPDGQHIGFIAEDVPDLVATKDRKGLSPMDIVAVVTKVVKNQQETIKNQDETIKTQGAAIQKQEKEIQALTAMLQQTLAGMSVIQHKVSQLEAAQKTPMLQKASYTQMVH